MFERINFFTSTVGQMHSHARKTAQNTHEQGGILKAIFYTSSFSLQLLIIISTTTNIT